MILRGNGVDWDNQTLVYLGTEDIEAEMERLDQKGIAYTVFREPDIGDEVTALACVSNGRAFSNLALF